MTLETDDGRVVALAIHRVVPEHEDAMIAFIHKTIDATADPDGLLDFRAYRDTQRGILAALTIWESPAAFQNGMQQLFTLSGERRPEWSASDDEIFTMTEIPRAEGQQ